MHVCKCPKSELGEHVTPGECYPPRDQNEYRILSEENTQGSSDALAQGLQCLPTHSLHCIGAFEARSPPHDAAWDAGPPSQVAIPLYEDSQLPRQVQCSHPRLSRTTSSRKTSRTRKCLSGAEMSRCLLAVVVRTLRSGSVTHPACNIQPCD